MPPRPSSAGWNTSFTVPASCGASSFSTAGHAEQRGGVDVVAAGMHQAGLGAGERQPGRLLDRQRVHVGADRQHRARPAALDQSHHAGPAHAGPVRECPAVSSSRATTPAVRTSWNPSLRMSMDVAPDLDQRRFDAAGWRRGSRWWDRWTGTLMDRPNSGVGSRYSRRSHDLVRRSASAELAVSRQGTSSRSVTHCQRAQPGQRTICSGRSGLISMRAPQQLHRLCRRGSRCASRISDVSNAPWP